MASRTGRQATMRKIPAVDPTQLVRVASSCGPDIKSITVQRIYAAGIKYIFTVDEKISASVCIYVQNMAPEDFNWSGCYSIYIYVYKYAIRTLSRITGGCLVAKRDDFQCLFLLYPIPYSLSHGLYFYHLSSDSSRSVACLMDRVIFIRRKVVAIDYNI